MRILRSVLAIVVVAPIWIYLWYKILVAVQATELMWFLFIIYFPASLTAQVITLYLEGGKREG